MSAKDVIAPQIVPLRVSAEPQNGVEARPIVDEQGRYVTTTVGYIAPVGESAPLSLVVERLSSGQTLVPVVEDDTEVYVGAVDAQSVLSAVGGLFPQLDDYTELTVNCRPGQYSASAIAHAVEDADAHLLNLNVTAGTQSDSLTTVRLRVNHSRGDSVARSLMRYGYDTVAMSSHSSMIHSILADRANAVIHLLEI